jgi:hypothetical protein
LYTQVPRVLILIFHLLGGLGVHLVTTTLNQFTVLSKLVQLVSIGLGVHLVTTTLNQLTVLSKLVQLISRGL